MRRACLTACVLGSLAAPAAAQAGEASGALFFCTGGDFCRYFTLPRLEVTFQAAAGETNNLRVLPHPDGVRIVDSGSALVPGAFCSAVNPHDVRCGPPAPAGLVARAVTGDGPDSAFTRTGSVELGAGVDLGIGANASVDGGPGDDTLRGWGDEGVLYGRA